MGEIYFADTIKEINLDKSPRIGILDSGLGGISVLKEILKLIPNEDYIYFGDYSNAPYGEKDLDYILERTLIIVDFLIKKGAKLIVIACNTATSATINILRDRYTIPIIGMEPAIKPASSVKEVNKIYVMATPFTLRERKFKDLANKIGIKNKLIEVPCEGLVSLIESDLNDEDKIKVYLENIFYDYSLNNNDIIVLGCTHYIFIKDIIKNYFNNKVKVLDGNLGTAKNIKNIYSNMGFNNKNINKRINFLSNNSGKKNIIKYIMKEL